ncbi:hypothetical protein E1L19_23535 [Salmonella enterica subsp. enterica]|nr:hypothetical protein [Salmonella enterica]ECI7828900.1 hypothetical protein [Salmonella enterica subsp. enterica]ECV7800765.1 hypothetical protein [Salmonella enterica subsp. enterica serovar Brandenburg]EIO7472010.1 hypothetical protein [Salmonella enterica subsp. enterica]
MTTGIMSAKGCCYDKACAESFFHSLKIEYIRGEHFISQEIRPSSYHSSCRYLASDLCQTQPPATGTVNTNRFLLLSGYPGDRQLMPGLAEHALRVLCANAMLISSSGICPEIMDI